MKYYLLILTIALQACKAADNDYVFEKDNSYNFLSECVKTSLDKYLVDSFSDSVSVEMIEYDSVYTLISLENQYAPGFWIKYVFAVKGETCTKIPVKIESTWGKNNEEKFDPKYHLLDDMQYSFTDINNDGSFEIGLVERVHNGTLYNASITSYYNIEQIDDHLRFFPVFAIENKTVHPVLDCIMHRRMINDTVKISAVCEGNEKTIGFYIVDWKDNQFSSITSKTINDSLFENILITGSNRNELDFSLPPAH